MLKSKFMAYWRDALVVLMSVLVACKLGFDIYRDDRVQSMVDISNMMQVINAMIADANEHADLDTRSTDTIDDNDTDTA